MAPMHLKCAKRWLEAYPRGDAPKCGACGVPLRVALCAIEGWRPYYHRWDPLERSVSLCISPVVLLFSWGKVTALNFLIHMALGTSFTSGWVWTLALLTWLSVYFWPTKCQVGIECRLALPNNA
jgi:hypothetical protein